MAAALVTLAELERLHPRFSRLYQERGHCHVVLRQAPQAIEAFLRAVNINHALPVSWGMLEGLYRLTGDAENAATAAAHVATLKQLPTEVVTATALFADGDLAAAEQLIRAFLLKHGHQVEAMRLLARIGIERDVLDDAQLLLEGVLELAPDYQAARFEYGQVLVKRHLYQVAQQQAEQLLTADPANRNYRTLHAMTCVGLGQHERAIGLYRGLLSGAAQPADLHLSVAHSLKTLGRADEAITEYRTAAAARPAFGDAYWSLANLKTYRFLAEEVEQMRAAEAAASTALIDRYHLCFALGKALEDRQQYQESFGFYARGNALKRSESRYQPQVHELAYALQIEVCARRCSPPAARRRARSDLHHRSTTLRLTLIAQILASHSAVEGTRELAEVPRLVVELQGRDWTRIFRAIRGARRHGRDFRSLGEVPGHARLPHRQRRASSTRCRTTSATWG